MAGGRTMAHGLMTGSIAEPRYAPMTSEHLTNCQAASTNARLRATRPHRGPEALQLCTRGVPPTRRYSEVQMEEARTFSRVR